MAYKKERGFNTRKKPSATAVLNPNKEVINKKKKKKNTFINSKFPCFGTASKKKTSHTLKKNGSSNNRGGNITNKPTIDDDNRSILNTTTSTSNSVVIDDDNFLVFEILTRLQVKSLVRFKSVCRNWYPLIQNNHHNFIDSHFTLSKTRPPRLLIVIPVPPRRNRYIHLATFCVMPPRKGVCITADLNMFSQDKQITFKPVFDTISKGSSLYYHVISKPVNGLICLIDKQRCSVRIYNVSTRQLSPWFHSELLNQKEQILYDELDGPHFEDRYQVVKGYYGFGFDPATNVHKLVCLYRCYADDHTYFTICEVLIIGGRHGNKWRIIELPSPYELSDESIYVNGVIYWSMAWDPYGLVAFDVGSDKFRTIAVSESMLDHLEFFNDKRYVSHDEKVSLFEVDGRVAMIIRTNTDLFKMYVYEDDDDEMNRTSSGSCIDNRRWNEACSLTLPFNLGKDLQVKFSTFVGSHDKILLTCLGYSTRTKNKSAIYCYNWKKGSLTKFDISGIPSSVPPLGFGSFLTTFSESLLPVRDHNISCSPS